MIKQYFITESSIPGLVCFINSHGIWQHYIYGHYFVLQLLNTHSRRLFSHRLLFECPHVRRAGPSIYKVTVLNFTMPSVSAFNNVCSSLFQCGVCSAVFHVGCLDATKPCPKCERRQKREDLSLLKGDSCLCFKTRRIQLLHQL